MASILSISMVGGVTTIITGILPQLEHEYPTLPTTMIEWLVTAANLSALVTLLTNSWFTKRWGIKRTVITGLIVSMLAGTAPLFSHQFAGLMFSRLVLGLGIGLFSPHAISLIVHVYSGDRQARLLGYQVGLGALGNAIFLAMAGVIVLSGWRNVFLLYLLLGLVALLAAAGLPEGTETPPTQTEKRPKLPLRNWGFVGLAFVTYLLIWGVQLKLPSLFQERDLGGVSIANWTLSAMNIGGMAAGLTFGLLYRKYHRFTLVIGYAGAAITTFLLLLAHQAGPAIIAAVLFNFIYSYTGPYLVFRSQQGLAPQLVNAMSSWLTIATIISAFFAPLLWNTLGQLGPGTVTDNTLLWTAVFLSLIAVSITMLFIRPHTAPIRKKE
ncbi:transport protein [Lactobacillus selangorensis]|uniref:Transport protein n=2 Tax=Lactobacillus selangorensis TaxID=81857 RepID=A0A0R2FLX8_9LACO|nr:transport protein [Lactobacillus selangorensis]KRN32875.1 transport protein [Lactobacillus selangorensis]